MAYAAVLSFKRTIEIHERLIHENRSPCLVCSNSTLQIIKLVYKEVNLLQKALEELDGSSSKRTERLNALDGEIREAVRELEDQLESHVLNQFLDQGNKISGPSVLSLDLEELKQDIDYFIEKVDKLKVVYALELQHPSPEEEEEGNDHDHHHLDGNGYSQMVGISKSYMAIRDWLTKDSSVPEQMVATLRGMTGLGKTTFAKNLLHDPLILTRFHIRVYVSIGPGYKSEDVLLDILKQVNVDHQNLPPEGEERLDALKTMMHQGLEGGTYFVVLDDLWDIDLWYLHLVDLFTWRGDGSHVLVTTTLYEVEHIAHWTCKCPMLFMDKQQSWDLLREKVFGKEWISCSYQLEKAWKKIAENCEGLPLTIVTVGNILSKSSEKMNITYLNEVAANKQHPVFLDAYDQMFKVLYPNYNYLPQHLKPCFLYMAIFPLNDEDQLPHLLILWNVEGFVEPDRQLILDQLRLRSLVMPTDTLHPAFWHMCKKIAANDKFFHTLNIVDDGLVEDVMESQQRLCIHNNVLFGIKDACDSMAFVHNLRSLLCTGLYHEYPVPICVESWRLLRILHGISLRFYEFPMQVLKLIQLRYLALTYDGNLPHLIIKNWNLQYLIVHLHLNIVESDGSSSYLPTEIWDMQRLSVLQVMGSNLPRPPCETAQLPQLISLGHVSAQSCTKDVFERIPNLRALEIQIELAPDATNEALCVFDHISHLTQLRALKCVVANPVLKPACKAFAPLSVFPTSLVLLTLSGLGYPWEEINKISSLPNLRYLMLQCCAFRGSTWAVRDKGFRQLAHLTIEDSDLVHWTVEDSHCLGRLQWVDIRHCYKLEEIPLEFSEVIEKVELIDCNPLAVSCVKQLKAEFDRKYYGHRLPLRLSIQSSYM